ncbi:MAG: UDP-N-acetylmuramoyl-tripeptide--D-alanyl-D-alanine ligase [Candidatus Neomarinimicrobiota bacterium]
MRIDLPDPERIRSMIEELTGQKIEILPRGISLDSREVKPGDLFVAIVGKRVDGHDFLDDAKEHGCVATMVTTLNESGDPPQIIVENPVEMLGTLAKQWRSNFSLPIIGITGTNGKTTTKDLMIQIFSATYHVHGTRGNYNTELGLPLTLLELTSHHTLSILEMGANQRGDIGYLCGLSQPRYGLITNIALAHLQDFGSIEDISRSKGELFESLPPDGIAFVNAEDERVRSLHTEASKISYGFHPGCDFSAELHQDGEGLFSLTINGEHISLNSYSKTFAVNALASCAVSITNGVSWESFQEAVLTFTPSSGRCEIKNMDGITLIDDSYNANFASTLTAIELLLTIPVKGRRILVFGDMLELGKESESLHRQVGQRCAKEGIDLLLCYGDESRLTAEAAKSAINARHLHDKHDLVVILKEELDRGDVVLFKGSRGMALETVIDEVFGP